MILLLFIDVVRANILAAESNKVGKGEVINIGRGSNYSVNELAKMIGGSTKFMALANPDKTVHAFDTFDGLPKPLDVDKGQTEHRFKSSYEDVKDYLSDNQNVKIYKGRFPETSGPIVDKKFCVVHVDVDLYQSALDCCEFFYPRMTDGGVIIFDDYYAPNCKGLKSIVTDFFNSKSKIIQDGSKTQVFILI